MRINIDLFIAILALVIFLAAIFSFTGGQLGSKIMAEKLKGRTVRQIFGIVLLIFVAKLVQRVI
jgi:uncharacterized membrane protein YfcA